MTRNHAPLSALILLVLVIGLSACQPDAASSLDEHAPTSSLTPGSGHSATPVHTATVTPTPKPTYTETPAPTATIRWDDLDLALTPLPLLEKVISVDNADRLQELAVWGTGRVNDIALSPDGLNLAVGTNIGVYIYDSLSFQLLQVLQTPDGVISIAFSKDNQWLALGQHNGKIDIYDHAEMRLITRLTSNIIDPLDVNLVTVFFSENGAYFTSIIETSEDIGINRWDSSTWEAVESFSIDIGQASYINSEINVMGIFSEVVLTLQSLSFQQESTSIPLPAVAQELFWRQIATYACEVIPASGGDFILVNTGSTIVHWHILDEEVTYLLNDYPQKLSDPCYAVPDTCLNKDGGYSWTCSDAPIPPIEMVALTPDDIMMLVSLNRGQIEFRRASDGMLAWEIDVHYSDITFSPGSEFFFGLREDGTIEKRSTLDGELMDSLSSHPAQLFDLAFSPDGSVLAVSSNDKWIRVYDLSDGKMLGVLTGSARSVSFSPDGSLLAAGLTDGTVRIFELEAGTFHDLSPGHAGAVTDLAFTADGCQVITSSDDCTVSIWNLIDGHRMANISPDAKNPFRIGEVEISPDTLHYFIAGTQGNIYRVEGTIPQQITLSNVAQVMDLALSPDGGWLASAGIPPFLLPNPESILVAEPLEIDTEKNVSAYATAFTLDNALLILATPQDLMIWSVADTALLSSLPYYEAEVPEGLPADLEISPDGTRIILGTQDGLIHIFGITSAD